MSTQLRAVPRHEEVRRRIVTARKVFASNFLSLEDVPFDEALCVSDDKLVLDLSDADTRLAS